MDKRFMAIPDFYFQNWLLDLANKIQLGPLMLSQKEAPRMHPHFLHSIRGTGNPSGGPLFTRPFTSVCDNIDAAPVISVYYINIF